MIPAWRHTAPLAVAVAALAGPAVAVQHSAAAVLDAWAVDGARIFSQLCMGSAPDFTTLRARALAEGFREVDGRLLFEPAAEVELRDNGDTCACVMMLGAPEFPRLLVAVVDRLRADYPASRPDDSAGGHGHSAFYEREGEYVRLVLNPETFKQMDFLAGWVIARGGCQS